jgi:phospholipase C
MNRSRTCLLAGLLASPAFVLATGGAAGAAGSNPIKHVVIIVQEQRSFDNLFCHFPGGDGSCAGLQAIPLEAKCKISSTFQVFERDLKSGDFAHGRTECPRYTRPQYGYVPARETAPYQALAASYVLADRMFSSTGNPAFESHQYFVAAQAANAVDEPFGSAPSDGCYYQAMVRQFGGPPQPACFAYNSMPAELSEAGATWKYYRASGPPAEPAWDAPGWLSGLGDPSLPSSQFLSDVGAGELATVSWVTPEYANSDESGSQSKSGPAWVASIVNAVGETPYWDSTAIFIVWDGFGGWADHVTPPHLDNEGLGFRVPLIVVSAYALQGRVSHVQYETSSLLKFIEGTFGLPSLGATDARANSPTDCFNFNQSPRPFTPI